MDEFPIQSMTFNVRCDDPDDDPPWSERRHRVVDAIAGADPDIVGLQEALHSQFSYVRERLMGYEWHGVGREGGDDGEHVPLGWRSDRFEAVETGAFWLSETPDRPSVGWDADLPRIATWADLRSPDGGARLWVCATHLSHAGAEARLRSSALLRERVERRLEDGDACVLLGDFNFEAGSAPYEELTASALVDARTVATRVEGPEGTYQGWDGTPGKRIDYVFVPASAAVERYRTLPPATDGGFRSDHLPVVVDIARPGSDRGPDGDQ